MTFKEITKQWINKYSTNEQFEKLERYVKMIEEKNKVMNLTGFHDDQLWEEGIYESLVSLHQSFNGLSGHMLDIGAGAGFPSIPYVIAFPKVQLTIHEPLNKRVAFLLDVVDALKLNVEIKKVRTEESKEKEIYDFITARAVTNSNALIELSSQVGKVGAQYSFIKGPSLEDELLKTQMFDVTIKNIKNLHIKKTIKLLQYQKNHSVSEKYPRTWKEISAEFKNKK